MSVGQRAQEGKRPAGTARTITALAVVGLLLVFPAAAVFVAVTHAAPTARDAGSSGVAPAWEKPVRFVETGLTAGTVWSVNLSGSLGSSDTTTITFSEIPGVYPFSVTPVLGYTAVPSSGNVTVGNCGATVEITFTPVAVPANYTVFFNETGLAPGTAWWVNFNGTNTTSSTPSISYSVPNGTYPFMTPGVVSGFPGEQFVTNVTNGTVVVNGTEVLVVVPYSTEYYLTTYGSPPGSGMVTPASGWYPAGAIVNLSAVPNAGYLFLYWNGSGNGNYSGTNATPSVTMNDPIIENATFGIAYAVDFEEIGLLDGVTWSVTFNGVTQSAYFVFLDFSAANGVYPYTVAPIPGYHADLYAGNVTVAGLDQTIVIHWTRITYNVTFVESGLPSGTSWSVTLNGSQESAVASTLLFVVSNGSYPFTVAPISGYTPNVTSGKVVVNGSDVQVNVSWTPNSPGVNSYTILFVETGLLPGSQWSVSLNGTGSRSALATSTQVAFTGVANGAYHYWVPDVGSYHSENSTGTVDVSGANVTVSVPFDMLGPAVLPSGSSQVSVEDLVVFALIGAGGLIATYLIFRRV